MPERNQLLFELLALHRLWRVPRWQMTQLLDLSKRMAELKVSLTFPNVTSFEKHFKASGYCLTPTTTTIKSEAVAHIPEWKIGAFA
jgi:hypothetical protein